MHLPPFLLLLALAILTSALPQPPYPHRCRTPHPRKEWRTLTRSEKSSYIGAVKCLMASPGKLQSQAAGVKTRYEDFIFTHQNQTARIHSVGQFLPWHRLLLHEFEGALRRECGYRGYLPWWDMKRDLADFSASPIFSPTTGFGGNGALNTSVLIPWVNVPFKGGGCIISGPFKDVVVHLGRGNDSSYHERCITRNIYPAAAERWMTSVEEERLVGMEKYEGFAPALEGGVNFNRTLGVHNGGHISVSGDMGDTFVSPTEPLFYLHHANLDRIWTRWQEKNTTTNLYAMGNPIAPRYNSFGWVDPPKGNVTMDYVLDVGPLLPVDGQRTVAQVIDTRGSSPKGKPKGILCYQYVG